MNKTGLIAKISIKYVLPTCTWKYFWRISRHFAFFWKFRGISRKYLNFAGPRPCEISEALTSSMVFPFPFFFHFSNNFSLLVTLLFIIIRENLKKLIVNVNKQKDALKKNGITVDGVHYAVRFKGKLHIIINKAFFSTIFSIQYICLHVH